MPSKLLFDPTQLNFDEVEFDVDAIRKINPQRYEFEQLSGILKVVSEEDLIIGYRDIGSNEFWVRGHIPGNPIFPGILMLESAAQLCSFYCSKKYNQGRFYGFGAVDRVRFRGTVLIGDRLVLAAKAVRSSKRLSIFYCQGVVRDKLVFEAEITGVSLS